MYVLETEWAVGLFGTDWASTWFTGISAETIKWAQETEMDGTGLAVA